MTTQIDWVIDDDFLSASDVEILADSAGVSSLGHLTTELGISIQQVGDSSLTWDAEHRRLTSERYRLAIGPPGGSRQVSIEATSRAGVRFALVDLVRRLQGNAPEAVKVEDGPAFATRGAIEGFYGSPWTHEQRLDMISFLAANRFNTFMYAPKDDPYLRANWREPHTGDALERLVATLQHCVGHDIDSMVGLSPGLSMRYSDEADVELLLHKVRSLVDIGASRIALLFDDIPTELQHEEDRARFATLSDAHATVSNRVADLLRGLGVPMTVCPTTYFGQGDEEYISRLGSALSSEVDMFWTGRAICSPAITAAEAVLLARSARRPALYWDNYPVNDVAMTNELHIGPYRNRDPLLHRFSVGVMVNAMEHPEASKLAMATIGDYLWDPDGYEPQASAHRARHAVAGPQAEALAMLDDVVIGSCMAEPDPADLGAEVERFEFDIVYGDPTSARQRLKSYGIQMAEAAQALLADDVANAQLAREIRPWVEAFEIGAEAVIAIAEDAEIGRLQDLASQLRSRPQQIFGNLLDVALTSAIERTDLNTASNSANNTSTGRTE